MEPTLPTPSFEPMVLYTSDDDDDASAVSLPITYYLCGGGVDTAIMLSMFKTRIEAIYPDPADLQKHLKEILKYNRFVFFDYGQFAASPEERSLSDMTSYLGLTYQTMQIEDLHDAWIRSGREPCSIFSGDPKDDKFLPDRNEVFLQHAIKGGADRVVFAFDPENPYFDCTEPWCRKVSSWYQTEVVPALRLRGFRIDELTYSQYVNLEWNQYLPALLNFSLSCYTPVEDKTRGGKLVPCGVCEKCAGTKRVFNLLGVNLYPT